MAFAPRHSLPGALLATIATAALFYAGNGMNPVWPLVWIAPLPILLFAAEAASWPLVGAAAALSMLLGGLPMLHYLHGALRLPITAWLIPFTLASLLFAAGVLLFRVLLRKGRALAAVTVLPALWTAAEYFSSFAPANGTAGSLAYTQLRFFPVLQLASITGPWGITFLLLLLPSAVAAAFSLRSASPARAARVLIPTLALVAAVLLFGVVRLHTPAASQSMKVGLLATDRVELASPGAPTQDLIHDYAQQAEHLADQGARIIVMPEKTGVLLDTNAPAADSILQSVADRTGATLVLGLVHVVAPRSYNEARIFTPRAQISTYDKQHMLPPFESKLTPGTALTLLPAASSSVGVAICKDMDFVHPALDYGRAGIALLLDPAWDFNIDRAWHGHIAIMRGVENGYAIAHTAKDGFLTVTDNRGRILSEVRSDSAPFASLLVDVPLQHENTLFDRWGTWFPWVAVVLLLVDLVQAVAPASAAD